MASHCSRAQLPKHTSEGSLLAAEHCHGMAALPLLQGGNPEHPACARAGTEPSGCSHGALCVIQDHRGEHTQLGSPQRTQLSAHTTLGSNSSGSCGQSVTPKHRHPALLSSWPCSSCWMNKAKWFVTTGITIPTARTPVPHLGVGNNPRNPQLNAHRLELGSSSISKGFTLFAPRSYH